MALAVAAGSVDAASYLGLGRVFTANMTGNTVLLGVALARGSASDAARSAVALGGFCVGAGVGVLLVARTVRWPRSARSAFVLEAAALAVLLALWAATRVAAVRYPLILTAAVAMGAQSAAVRASHVSGVNTTYMTGTLMNAIARLGLRARGIRESREGPTLPGAAWATYAAGAVGGAFATTEWQAAAVAFPLAIVCTVCGGAFHATREER